MPPIKTLRSEADTPADLHDALVAEETRAAGLEREIARLKAERDQAIFELANANSRREAERCAHIADVSNRVVARASTATIVGELLARALDWRR